MTKSANNKPIIFNISFLLLLNCFFFSLSVSAQNNLTESMAFEDAERIALQSIRRTSAIRNKRIDFKGVTKYGELAKLLMRDKYARSCLSVKAMWDISDKKWENTTIPAKQVDNSSNQKQTDDDILTKSLSYIEGSLNKKCFFEKRVQLTDTLAFLGVIDDFRLAALRRYLVRNAEIGVKSVWGYNNQDVAQAFIVTNAQFENITTGTTVLDLALKIQSSAGLPFLPYDQAEKIVKDCRSKTTTSKDATTDDTLSIFDDFKRALPHDSPDAVKTKIGSFVECLETAETLIPPKQGSGATKSISYKYGVNSVKVRNSEGNELFYRLLKTDRDLYVTKIENNNFNYAQLIEAISNDAIIPPPVEFIATRLVINAILKVNIDADTIRFDDRKMKPFQLSEVIKSIPVARAAKHQPNCSAPTADEKNSVAEISIGELCMNADEIYKIKKKIEEILNSNSQKSYYYLDKNGAQTLLTKIAAPDISPADTIEQIIEKVILILNSK